MVGKSNGKFRHKAKKHAVQIPKERRFVKDFKAIVSTTVATATGSVTSSTDQGMEVIAASLSSSVNMESILPLSVVYSKTEVQDLCKKYAKTKLTGFSVEIGIYNSCKSALTFVGYFDYNDSYRGFSVTTRAYLASIADKKIGAKVVPVLPGSRKTISMSGTVYGSYMTIPEDFDLQGMLAQRKAPWSFLFGIDREDKDNITVTVKTKAYLRFKGSRTDTSEVKAQIAKIGLDVANRKKRQEAYERSEGAVYAQLARFIEEGPQKMKK